MPRRNPTRNELEFESALVGPGEGALSAFWVSSVVAHAGEATKFVSLAEEDKVFKPDQQRHCQQERASKGRSTRRAKRIPRPLLCQGLAREKAPSGPSSSGPHYRPTVAGGNRKRRTESCHVELTTVCQLREASGLPGPTKLPAGADRARPAKATSVADSYSCREGSGESLCQS